MIYNPVAHPIDTLGGIAKLAGVAVVGYSSPIPGITPEQRLSMFDAKFGTNLSQVNDGIKQSLADTGDTLLHGTNEQRGEIVGQAIEFVAEIAVGTKGAGGALKAAKGGEEAAILGKDAVEIVDAVGKGSKAKVVSELPEATKGIFGKGEPKLELPENATNMQKGNFGEIVSKDNMIENPALKQKGYDLERIGNDAPKGLNDAGHKGIDGIYENKTPPPKYVIDEAKYGKSQLSKTPKDGPQMSDDWMKGSKRLEEQIGPDKAKGIKDALDNGDGNVEKVLSKVDENGKVTTYRINKDGSVGTRWP